MTSRRIPGLFPRIFILALLVVTCIATIRGPRSKEQAGATLQFDEMIPHQLGEWQFEPIDRKFSSLDFINELFEGFYRHGQREVVLSVEYGSDFGRAFELHIPDHCHRIRGDKVLKLPSSDWSLNNTSNVSPILMEWEYPERGVKALCAYWFVIDGRHENDVMHLKMGQLVSGLLGRHTQATLVRVDYFYGPSRDRGQALDTLEEFVRDLSRNLPSEVHRQLFGF